MKHFRTIDEDFEWNGCLRTELCEPEPEEFDLADYLDELDEEIRREDIYDWQIANGNRQS